MSRWVILKKAYLLLAAIIILMSAWPTSFFHLKTPPPPPIPVIEAPAPLPPALPYEENYYDIYLNNVLVEKSVLVLKDKSNHLWLPVKTVEMFHFQMPDTPPKKYWEENYLNMASFPGVTYTIDLENLALKITAPLEVFRKSTVDLGASKIIEPTLPPWGSFLNYNFFASNQSATNHLNALFGIGLFGPLGVGTSTFNWTTNPAPRPWVRLLSTWTVDRPATMQTLSLGDVVSRSTNWSGSVNYGGLQWGRNFNTQPAFITFPLPGYRGTAIVPSVLDLYVNGSMSGQHKVNPGVFDIVDVPVVTGAGNVTFVTKDILGREQVFTASYYVNTTLLEKGLTSYTLDLGILREDLGVFSNHYSKLIGALTYNIGLTDSTTFGFHGEALSYQQAAGFTVINLLGKFGVITGSAATSHSDELGTGGLLALAFQRQTNLLSFGYSSQYTTENFTQQGLLEGQRSPKLINQGFASVNLGNGSLSFNYTKIINRNDIPSLSFLTVTASTTLLQAISVNATLQNSLSGPRNKSFLLNLAYAINENLFTTAGYSDVNDERVKTLQLQRALPAGPGYGFNLMARRDAVDSDEASLSLQNDIGTYIVQGQRVGDRANNISRYSYSLDVKGGVIYMDHHLELSRQILNSFGFVKTSDYPNVDVYWENQLMGSTNEQGYLMIPNLLPYQYTKVNLDPNTVPLNTQISKYEIEAAPYRNSGMIVAFDIYEVHSAIMTLKQASGANVPEGATVRIEDNEEEFFVGLEGQLYITGGKKQVKGQAQWKSGSCNFSYTAPPQNPDNPFPNIGNVICR